jgi:hypothetical protein
LLPNDANNEPAEVLLERIRSVEQPQPKKTALRSRNNPRQANAGRKN